MNKRTLAIEALRFIAVFAVVALACWLAFSATTLPNEIAAFSANAVLTLFGKAGALTDVDGVPHLVFSEGTFSRNKVDAELSALCAGSLELAVLLGAIAASEDRSVRKRALGCLGAVAFVAIINPARIAFTLLYADSLWLPTIHDVAFRVSLVVLTVFYYAAWYYWLSTRK
ncbi:hypothetical protein AUJ65_02270 [Candidatus Micrarchaeota archaeon CG1_02_51_15]|nr:MAG: hypothetical protein AUJ65_02270 [Candidatus Micrarchaeota archaeon CG1_02_51_15]